MAEEIVVKEPLTEEMKRGGAELTRKLLEANWPLTAAFWYFVSSGNRWKLMLASPQVETEGLQHAYEVVHKALRTIPEEFGGLRAISVVWPNHETVRALASAIGTERKVGGMRVFQRMGNGRYIDDAYVYRMMPESAAA
jgi:hypothetical protein